MQAVGFSHVRSKHARRLADGRDRNAKRARAEGELGECSARLIQNERIVRCVWACALLGLATLVGVLIVLERT